MAKLLFISIAAASMMTLALVATANPTFGQDSGIVNATVNVAVPVAPCITLSATSIDYGTQKFNSDAEPAFISVTGPNFTLTSCTRDSENILARGTDAKGSGTGAWALSSTFRSQSGACTIAGDDEFSHVVMDSSNASIFTSTSTTNQTFASMGAGQSMGILPLLFMPCTGSSGVGETMSTDIIFTAVVP